ncbi:hypothetical protein [Microcoleus sp. Pol12B5]|uniref:hypothetical protein n=1 Tax=Microcoleus sp. Pol12B5 TaxID=3055396 RepID=UPI002FD61F70
MTNNIVRIPDEIRNEFRIGADGKAFVSIRGAARIADINDKTLGDSLKTAAGINPSKLAQSLTDSGFEPAGFSETGIPDIALAIVLKYYAYKAKRTTEQAEQFYDAMSAVGIRTWIQQQLNWNPISSQAPYWYQRLMLFLAQNKVPAGYFSIFQETITLVGDLESAGYVLPDNAIPDISIGKCWANYLRAERINPNDVAISYPHQYPGWAKSVDANAYPEELLPKFRKWFREAYRPTKLPNYLAGKDADALPALSKMLGVPIRALK